MRLLEPLATHDEIANGVVDKLLLQVLSGILETCHVLVAGFLLGFQFRSCSRIRLFTSAQME